MAHVLMVVTAADELVLADGASHKTGFWAEELVELHRGLTAAGHSVDIATPGARRPPVDPGSLDLETESGRELQAYLDRIADALDRPLALSEVADGAYDAIVLPGGHGPMADLAHDADLGRLLVDAADRDAVVGVLCHGPAGLLSAIRRNGDFAFAGRELTVFTDDEERLGGLGDSSPYLVESRLRELGAVVRAGAPWSSTVVADGALVSGQNPQSSVATAQRLVAQLAKAQIG
ncbi:type 1 glutamine amidotransferase domain-containing protein [Microbacterium ulmi]|uniref:Type 1 glutamine amidotransferase domain-containing protein n=1 Tax=Microbacterium ulmi TaxID=179095 RepID=A0A7Y2LYC4_9MICO|nr:type 1 glutamine amidotransferase domain-containing protein [Microbacterium ulmi]NII70836.1 putative intracellular protease/amidase [Microbacterium ulmi]NNH02852.1 type 1 glutamine amidotransferase domain-containing protein [Microbacterium ulmi]